MPKRKRDPWAEPKKRRKNLPREWLQKYVQDGPQGFSNSGVFCYRLVLMQCLLHTPVLLRYIETIHKPRGDDHDSDNCVLCAFQKVIKAYWITRDANDFPKTIETDGVLAELWKAMRASIIPGVTSFPTEQIIGSQFQEDPAEFFSAVLEMLGPGSATWTRRYIFELHYTTYRDCAHCQRQFFDPNRSHSDLLPIAIVTPAGANLETYLDNYFVEHVYDDVACPNAQCPSNRDPAQRSPSSSLNSLFSEDSEDGNDNDHQTRNPPASRHRIDAIRITAAPEVLCIQLKRFGMPDRRGRPTKLTQDVPYPLELSLRPWVDPSAARKIGSLQYQLQGVVCHKGPTIASGHYVSIVRERQGDGCAVLNDHKITRYANLDVLADLRNEKRLAPFHVYCLVYMKVAEKKESKREKKQKEPQVEEVPEDVVEEDDAVEDEDAVEEEEAADSAQPEEQAPKAKRQKLTTQKTKAPKAKRK